MELKYSHLNPLQVTPQCPQLCSSSPCLTCHPQTTDSHQLPTTMLTTTLLTILCLQVSPRLHPLLPNMAPQILIMEINLNNSQVVMVTHQLTVSSSPLPDMASNPHTCECTDHRLNIESLKV